MPSQLILNILDLARWAPSADNSQPWRFEIVSDEEFLVHGYDTRDHCVYDLDGKISCLAIGALLETIGIAARSLGYDHSVTPHDSQRLRFRVRVSRAIQAAGDLLAEQIMIRSVQRRRLSTRAIPSIVKRELERSVAPSYDVMWYEGWANRSRFALLLSANGKLRLSLPEAFTVHRDVIEWGVSESPSRIPEKAVGLDPFVLKLTRWAFQSWKRVDFLNRFLAGTLVPRIELDIVPALACGAHFVLISKRSLDCESDYIEGGRALQRFWLTATAYGIQLQPAMSPLVFSRYHRAGIRYTGLDSCYSLGGKVHRGLCLLMGDDNLARAVFMGRIGYGRAASFRSIRKTVLELCVD